MTTPAQNLTKAIRDLFHLHGWYTFKCGATAARNKDGGFFVTGTPGSPDLICVKGQRYALVEIKAGKDRQSPSQIAFQASVENVFGNYAIVRSVEDAQRIIQGE